MNILQGKKGRHKLLIAYLPFHWITFSVGLGRIPQDYIPGIPLLHCIQTFRSLLEQIFYNLTCL